MKLFYIFPILIQFAYAQNDCQPPGQGFLEVRLKESFHVELGETELQEWMSHPKNGELRKEIRDLDIRTKFADRFKREELSTEIQVKFEQAISNTGRSGDLEHFPVAGSHSKLSGSPGALTLEMSKLSKEELDVIPKEVLDKLDPKVKINYRYPYDKFDYLLTFDGRELPMDKALLKVQKEMEASCERRMIENGEYRRWYQKNHGSGSSSKDFSSRQ